ncbi:MAG: hypothetical protein ACREHG_11290 [Candidatus Saccharimonadales bacterium]
MAENLFDEDGITKEADLTEAGKLLEQDMQDAFRGSAWILQGGRCCWQDWINQKY